MNFRIDDNKRFWEAFDPNISEVLSWFEERENWTLQVKDAPECFKKMEGVVDSITVSNSQGYLPSYHIWMDGLIMSLASLPFRECIHILAFLDSQHIVIDSQELMVSLIKRVSFLVQQGEGYKGHEHACVLDTRISVVSGSSIAVKMFNSIGE